MYKAYQFRIYPTEEVHLARRLKNPHRWTSGLSLVNFSLVEGITQESPAFRPYHYP